MKILTILPAFLFFMYGCSTSQDEKMAKVYPQCWHEYRNVFEKCIELNKSGQSVNAQRVEALMKSGELQ